MKILMVLTSHDRLGETGEKTGFWLEELAAPYWRFRDAGAEIVLASPRGGQPPLDPRSGAPEAQTEDTRRFQADARAMAALAATRPLAEVSMDDFDALFYPGGHGPLWDLAEDARSVALIERAEATGKPIGAVCHGPAALRRARRPDGAPLVQGRQVTAFSDSEEAAVGLTAVVPFSVEAMLRGNGGRYSKAADFQPYVVTDGRLVTGQNPASSAPAAEALLALLR
ncbi:type 1 glutamine amidotransferase domain-containing protein [Pseudoxanthomonas taiwanensis]|jgi:putative intracellular protease/amidase|uniref:Type 1 glutamine amidotransferase domain-containing protein n=1 Tax=Pseudoxanthomonas taiwanensis TaxID=176598 RepID=A0A921NWC1_9GAMM|nr:type 1 glutamine amidotransferase domain-containing protein [Pseudoxanthomonas taiwanensis]KAF1689732.1 type 1 glutamine amidotransferase domain-containing protein [Pseudoxanthomonas taiwanensis]MBO2468590.1 type 1 glutamine amidotransferase domain-containing protein [Xanthomonadaceae bacterium]